MTIGQNSACKNYKTIVYFQSNKKQQTKKMKTTITVLVAVLSMVILISNKSNAQISKRTVERAILQYGGKLKVRGEVVSTSGSFVMIRSLEYGTFKALVLGAESDKVKALVGRKGNMHLILPKMYDSKGARALPKLVGISK